MKFTFTCENGNKTTIVSFDASGSETAILSHFFNFLKGCGYNYNKGDYLKVVETKTISNYTNNQTMYNHYDVYSKMDFTTAPADYAPNNFGYDCSYGINSNLSPAAREKVDFTKKKIDLSKINENMKMDLSGFPGISEETFKVKPIGPADC